MSKHPNNNPTPTEGRKTLWQLVKYCSVSFTQTFVELGVFTLLRFFLAFTAANAMAVACSATYQFLMNRNLTFKSSSNFARSVVLFVLMWIWNFAFSTFATSTLSGNFGWDASLVKFMTMGCQAVWGFLLSKYVIFK